jgi:uncharacterized protein (DUF362 family)
MDRRHFLKAALVASLAPVLDSCGRDASPRWQAAAYQKQARSRVAILEARSYEKPLTEIVLRGIRLFGLQVRRKIVVLKPNLVEYDPEGVINTHPALIAATLEAFRSLGAREVIVAEGPGHRRDNEHVLTASGLHEVLEEYGARYVDLNYDRVRRLKLRSRFTNLGRLYLPETVLGADLLVSMPKLKTHHWAGVTLSMKNLFGIVPGAIYGWPKNALHWAGIDASIVDINSTLSVPRFNIVDAIVGMEGNGPIQGTPKPVGALILGEDPVAVDATGARLMAIEPGRVSHLRTAGRFLGNVEGETIEQIGETLGPFRKDFAVLERLRSLKETLVKGSVSG